MKYSLKFVLYLVHETSADDGDVLYEAEDDDAEVDDDEADVGEIIYSNEKEIVGNSYLDTDFCFV